jgi:hypothetical protein
MNLSVMLFEDLYESEIGHNHMYYGEAQQQQQQ